MELGWSMSDEVWVKLTTEWCSLNFHRHRGRPKRKFGGLSGVRNLSIVRESFSGSGG